MLVAAGLAFVSPGAGAQVERPVPSLAAPGDTVSVVPGAEYATGGPLGWLDRWLFGARYRKIWTTPVRAPVLSLAAFGGGLSPITADSEFGTTRLYLRSAERGDYVFRVSNPHVSPLLPAGLRSGAVTGPLQDLVSALHPGAALVVAPLSRAVGIREPEPTLGIMAYRDVPEADRKSFGGQLGVLEPQVTGSEAGVQLSSVALLARLDSGTAPVDARAYLAERIFDVYVGHVHLVPGAQRWMLSGSPERWVPLPSDHDLAFARFDGLLATLAQPTVPFFTVFGRKYQAGLGETEYQLTLDRRFLDGLDRLVWDSVSMMMQARLTDSVIEASVRALPPAWDSADGGRLVRALKARRDHLPEAARTLYRELAREPDLYVAAGTERVLVERTVPGELAITIPPSLRRSFATAETREVRLYLSASHPVIVIRGSAYGGPPLRIIAGPGGATIIDSGTAVARTLYVNDSAGRVSLDNASAGERASVSRAPFALPAYVATGSASLVKPAEGVRWGPVVWFGLFGDLGVLVGGGVERIGFENGYTPERTTQRLRAGWATKPDDYAVEYLADFRFQRGAARLHVDLKRTGIALLKFYGLGNETPRDSTDSYYFSRQIEYLAAPTMVWRLSSTDTLAAGPIFKYVRTDTTVASYINSARPFGYPTFEEVGVQVAWAHDTRDSPLAPERGWLLAVRGKYFGPWLDAKSAFGGVGGAVSTYWTADAQERLTIAVRAGGEKVWGQYPVFEAAYIGGANTVGGLRPQRYAGDASLFGNLEARWKLAPLPFVLRWDFGVSAIADVGRVYTTGDASRAWHSAFGGGIWAMLPDRSMMMNASLMFSESSYAVYAGTSFPY